MRVSPSQRARGPWWWRRLAIRRVSHVCDLAASPISGSRWLTWHSHCAHRRARFGIAPVESTATSPIDAPRACTVQGGWWLGAPPAPRGASLSASLCLPRLDGTRGGRVRSLRAGTHKSTIQHIAYTLGGHHRHSHRVHIPDTPTHSLSHRSRRRSQVREESAVGQFRTRTGIWIHSCV